MIVESYGLLTLIDHQWSLIINDHWSLIINPLLERKYGNQQKPHVSGIALGWYLTETGELSHELDRQFNIFVTTKLSHFLSLHRLGLNASIILMEKPTIREESQSEISNSSARLQILPVLPVIFRSSVSTVTSPVKQCNICYCRVYFRRARYWQRN